MAKKNPVSEYLAKIGKKGGQVKGAKGFGAMSAEQRAEIQAKGVAARKKQARKKKQ